jgi:TfoX/Sxy family transcriptional regulator of competence genes
VAIDPIVLAGRVVKCLPFGYASRKAMFGGQTFLHRGNMLCCVSKKGLMVRVGAAGEPAALASPFATRCLGAGRPMAGFVLIEPRGLEDDGDLVRWLAMARVYVEPLPEKPPKNKKLLNEARSQQSHRRARSRGSGAQSKFGVRVDFLM